MKQRDSDRPSPLVFQPPRPNRGPEPWTSPRLGSGENMTVCAIVGLMIAFAVKKIWKWRTSRLQETKRLALLEPGFPRWTHSVRSILADALGDAWLTKTSEEVERSGELADMIGRTLADEIARFLRESDRARFRKDGSKADSVEDWSVWVDRLRGRIRSRKRH